MAWLVDFSFDSMEVCLTADDLERIRSWYRKGASEMTSSMDMRDVLLADKLADIQREFHREMENDE